MMRSSPANEHPVNFDALLSGLLKVDPKQMPPKPSKKKVAVKKTTRAAAKKQAEKKKA